MPGNSVQGIDELLLGDDSTGSDGRSGNQASLDSTGENQSGVTFPVGAVIPISTAAIPAIQFTETDASVSTLPAPSGFRPRAGSSAYVSGIYELTLSSVNYTDRGITISLAYDKANADLTDLAMYHFNTSNSRWEIIPGVQTIDPVKGTVSAKIKSLASVLGLPKGHPLRALSDGKSYRPNDSYRTSGLRTSGIPLRLDDSGSFALVKPSLVGGSFSGTIIKIFNFPNPFNLSSKTLTLANGGGTPSITTSGTVIKIELPSGVSGTGYVRVYTLAGELVREIDLGPLTGGSYIYTQWDGKNKSGVDVANGVYYGIFSIPGIKAKDATFKMAVVK
ncbi:MAG: hypothetical protein HY551_00400 [Elusimicrobia bacterium]|nr:hypothetical protein [Elusimicrobiota bacterium]